MYVCLSVCSLDQLNASENGCRGEEILFNISGVSCHDRSQAEPNGTTEGSFNDGDHNRVQDRTRKYQNDDDNSADSGGGRKLHQQQLHQHVASHDGEQYQSQIIVVER